MLTFEDEPQSPLQRLTGFPLLATLSDPSDEFAKSLLKLGDPQLLLCKLAKDGVDVWTPPTLREGPKKIYIYIFNSYGHVVEFVLWELIFLQIMAR